MPIYRVGPNRWSTRPYEGKPAAQSGLPRPYVISDTMEATEQVDGRFYTSKRAFRAVGRAHGLTEVGNEKLKPKGRASDERAVKEARRRALKKAIERVKN